MRARIKIISRFMVQHELEGITRVKSVINVRSLGGVLPGITTEPKARLLDPKPINRHRVAMTPSEFERNGAQKRWATGSRLGWVLSGDLAMEQIF
jgi:hypothetical protein